ncbi:MAG TPA: integrin alpha [Solirubrobacteraceae bacterium]
MSRTLTALATAAVMAVGAVTAQGATPQIDASSAARLTLVGAPGSATGSAIASLGDVNGDGRPDVAIGAPERALPGRPLAGTVYVVFGSVATGSVDLDALGAGGYAIVGGRNYRAGLGVAAAGDVDGDGRPDLLLSAPRKNGYKVPGSAFVVYGKADAATIDLSALTPAQGFEITGVAPSPNATPDDVAGPGDIDGDGHADLLVTGAGREAAVVYGARRRTTVDLRHLGARGFRIVGAGGGPAVAAAGDVNGDRRADLLLGAPSVLLPGRRFPVNSAFVVFGHRRTRTLDLRHLGTRGFRIGGLVSGRIARPAVAGVGDLSANGRADLLVMRDPGGAPGDVPQAAVVLGSRSTKTVDLARLAADRRGFRVRGEAAAPNGFSVLGPLAPVGDLNGDGVPDLGLGSTTAVAGGSSHVQSAFVVYGRARSATLALSDLGAGGFRVTGPPPPAPGAGCESRMGAALAPGGDFDGDGRGDLVVGAPGIGCAGRVFVIPAP